MENRMKTHGLSPAEMHTLLQEAMVGRLVTMGEDGFPYPVPVHFVFGEDTLYIHGLGKGQKIANLQQNPKVAFEVDKMDGLIFEENNPNPCAVNTAYQSVIIKGEARMVEDLAEKQAALWQVVKKHTPHLMQGTMSEKSIAGTGVIAVKILEMTGKYYK